MQLTHFKVTNYRSVWDSGWIEVGEITAFVGQNEAGKSNLFEALYRINPFVSNEVYNIDEDWPVDDWGNKDPSALVCEAKFNLTPEEIGALHAEASVQPKPEQQDGEEKEQASPKTKVPSPPSKLTLVASRGYKDGTTFRVLDGTTALDPAKVDGWAKKHAPKMVYIHDYELSGAQIELDQLAERLKNVKWQELSNEDQTIKIILDLAKIAINDFLAKGTTPEGRTTRTFDKKAASAYLSQQFRDLWKQKLVKFEIEVDGPTLNIFAVDDAVGMPVRLNRRSSGFRWHVSFAWKFTHASQGEYKECVLLLEEPGIHLHYSGQRDLLDVFDRLAANKNTILYTTHLASMVDLANPERVRIVETKENHTVAKKGVVSETRAPMAVIEMALGLTGDMSGLLGTRQTLIVEGGDDALVLYKLSGILEREGKEHLSDRIYLWPAHGAPNTPMFAAFAVGQGWTSGVLLDTDEAGLTAKKKIDELVLKHIAEHQEAKFGVIMLGQAAAIKATDAAIEDLFDEQFYLDCVNSTYGTSINKSDLPTDGSTLIAKRAETALKRRGFANLDKRRVTSEMLQRFEGWKKLSDLPKGTAETAEKLFKAINRTFEESPK